MSKAGQQTEDFSAQLGAVNISSLFDYANNNAA